MGDDTFYMIVRLDERVPSRQKELSEVEKKINRIVKKEQKKELMDTWLGMVKSNKKFQLYPERLPEPEPEEVEEVEEKAETETEKAGTETEKTDEQKTSGEAVEEKSAE